MRIEIKSFIIKTNRIVIRPPTIYDAALLNKSIINSYAELNQWMAWATIKPSIEDTQNFIKFAQNCWLTEEPKELPFLIFDNYEKNLYGAISYNNINWEIPMLEIGYWGNKTYLGKGYMTEAVKLLTDYALKNIKVNRIEIRCDINNLKSAAIPKRLGYVLEARFRNHRRDLQKNKLSDTLIFIRYSE
ncbi:MAG: GCN5-related N-acetyltransferase [Francisellaceae bacterium]|nr:GCN5-related N-acetyltransferase [Francisellaceae bacterium]